MDPPEPEAKLSSPDEGAGGAAEMFFTRPEQLLQVCGCEDLLGSGCRWPWCLSDAAVQLAALHSHTKQTGFVAPFSLLLLPAGVRRP
jgi:hypothetical protein